MLKAIRQKLAVFTLTQKVEALQLVEKIPMLKDGAQLPELTMLMLKVM